jgi:hypothetical protein
MTRTNNWAAFETAEPELAATVSSRFGQYAHHVLATLRKDGSPRVTGLNVSIRGGELWLAMMPGSRKADDLRRDPRFALHTNPGADERMPDGDVRVAGRAVEITDSPELHRYAEEDAENPDTHPFALFRTELTEVVLTTIEYDDLVLTTWHPTTGRHTVLRTNADDPPHDR